MDQCLSDQHRVLEMAFEVAATCTPIIFGSFLFVDSTIQLNFHFLCRQYRLWLHSSYSLLFESCFLFLQLMPTMGSRNWNSKRIHVGLGRPFKWVYRMPLTLPTFFLHTLHIWVTGIRNVFQHTPVKHRWCTYSSLWLMDAYSLLRAVSLVCTDLFRIDSPFPYI